MLYASATKAEKHVINVVWLLWYHWLKCI